MSLEPPSIRRCYNDINPYVDEKCPPAPANYGILIAAHEEARELGKTFETIDNIPLVGAFLSLGLLTVHLIFKIQNLWYAQFRPGVEVFTSDLKIYVTEQRSLGQYVLSFIPFAALIAQIMRSISDSKAARCCARDMTYEGSEAGNCDWVARTRNGGIIHLDGTGHNNPHVARREHPVMKRFANDWAHFIDQFNFTDPLALRRFMFAEHHLFEDLNEQFNALMGEYREAETAQGNLRGARFENITNLEANTAEQIFNQILDWIDIKAVTRLIQRLEKASPIEEDDPLKDFFEHWSQVLFALRDGDSDLFVSHWSSIIQMLDHSREANHDKHRLLIQNINQLLTYDKNTHVSSRAGSAFAITQPLPIYDENKDGGYLFFRNLADVCLMVLYPAEGYDRIQLLGDGSIDPDSVSPNPIWASQSDTQFGDASDGDAVHNGVRLIGPFRQGAIALSFSDGIGEFLTRDEIKECFFENFTRGASTLLTTFKQKICESPQGENAERKQASRVQDERTPGCKHFDPVDSTYHDDISIGITWLDTAERQRPWEHTRAIPLSKFASEKEGESGEKEKTG